MKMRLTGVLLGLIGSLVAQSVSIISPTVSQFVGDTSLTLQAAITTLPSTIKIQYWIDGDLVCESVTAGGSWPCTWPSNAYPDAVHSVVAKAVDAFGAVLATSNAVSFTSRVSGDKPAAAFDKVQPWSGWVKMTWTTQIPVGMSTINCSVDGRIGVESPVTKNFSSANVNIVNDTITIQNHGIPNGSFFSFDGDHGTMTSLKSGITDLWGGVYYALVQDKDTVKIADSIDNMINGVAVDITDAGSGAFGTRHISHPALKNGISTAISGRVLLINTRRLRDGKHKLYCRELTTNSDRATSGTFAPSAVNTTTGDITITNHPLVTRREATFTSSGSLPGGLSSGATFYWARRDDNTVRVASSAADAATCAASGANCIVPSSQGTGTHTYNFNLDHPHYGGIGSGGVRNSSFGYVIADMQMEFETANGAVASEMRPAYQNLHLTTTGAGSTTDLNPVRIINADGTVNSTPAATSIGWEPANTSVCTVSSGVVTGVAGGFCTIRIYYGEFTDEVLVRVDSGGAKTFPHFSKDGSGTLLTSYDPARSLWVVAPFALDFTEVNQRGAAELKRAAINALTFGLDYLAVNPAITSFSSFLSTWNSDGHFSSIQTALNAFDGNFMTTGDDWFCFPGSVHRALNVTHSKQATKRVLDDLNTFSRHIGVEMCDEVNTKWGADPTPNDVVGPSNPFKKIEVTGCAATPCTGTGWIYKAASFIRGNQDIVLVRGATTTALNRHYKIQEYDTPGERVRVVAKDVVNGTYDSTNNTGMKALDLGMNGNVCASAPGGSSISVTGDEATVSWSGHGLVVGQSVYFHGITSDPDLADAWIISQVVDANTFKVPVKNVTAGAYNETTDGGMNLRALCYPDFDSDLVQRHHDEVMLQSTPDPLLSYPPSIGIINEWNTPPLASYTSYFTTMVTRTGRNQNAMWDVWDSLTRVAFNYYRPYNVATLFISGWGGPEYVKQTAIGTCDYQAGVDGMKNFGFTRSQVAAQMFLLVSLGMSGTRVYTYDSLNASAFPRCQSAPGCRNNCLGDEQQFHAGAASGQRDNFRAGARAFNLIRRIEKFAVSPNANALHYGIWGYSGLKEASDGSGRLFIHTNLAEADRTETFDLTNLKYTGGSVTRYRVSSDRLRADIITGNSDTVTLKQGETVLYLCLLSQAPFATRHTLAFRPDAVVNASKVQVEYNYIYDEEVSQGEVFDCSASPCQVDLDRSLGEVRYRFRYLDSLNQVLAVSDYQRLPKLDS